jgi:hypothetical protein
MRPGDWRWKGSQQVPGATLRLVSPNRTHAAMPKLRGDEQKHHPRPEWPGQHAPHHPSLRKTIAQVDRQPMARNIGRIRPDLLASPCERTCRYLSRFSAFLNHPLGKRPEADRTQGFCWPRFGMKIKNNLIVAAAFLQNPDFASKATSLG